MATLKLKKNRDLVKFFRSIPIFAGSKNAAEPTLITKKSRIFYAVDTPSEYELILDKTYNLCTLVEQSFSYDFLAYNLSTVPHRLPDFVDQFIGLVNCQALLTALAAVYTDQYHLVSSCTAFRYLSLANQDTTLRYFTELNIDRNELL